MHYLLFIALPLRGATECPKGAGSYCFPSSQRKAIKKNNLCVLCVLSEAGGELLRMKFFRLAEKEKIELGDWFVSPIHPITKDLELWHYRWGENPVAEKISQHIVNLPTHTGITEDYVGRIAQFLEKNVEMLERVNVPT